MKKLVSMCLVLLIAITASMSTLAITGCNKAPEKETGAKQETILAGGMHVGEIKSNGISLMSVVVPEDEYSLYGVTTTAEKVFMVTATVQPENARNFGINWSLSFDDETSEWATGKVVTDYVIINPSVDTLTNTVTCLQPFGTSIILTAKSQDNPEVVATCRLEYSQKVTGATLNIGNIKVNFGGNTEIKYEVSPAVSGPGGVIAANITTDDVYTIPENYTKVVTFECNYTDAEQHFQMKGDTVSTPKFVTVIDNWHGLEYYFDYNYDIKDWLITKRSGDIKFSELNTAEIIDYFSNITCDKLAVIKLALVGVHNSYEYSSQLICTGYTNNTPVNSVSLSQSSYIF